MYPPVPFLMSANQLLNAAKIYLLSAVQWVGI